MGILSWMGLGNNTLYYPGCYATYLKEEIPYYKDIFNKLGITFTTLENKELYCGLALLDAGYKKEAKKLAQKNYEYLKKNHIEKIITNSPSCYYMFNMVYPQFIKEWNITVEHAVTAILKGLKAEGIDFRGNIAEQEEFIYHDSCYLGRYGGIYDEPREIISRLGGKILEMKTTREQALCCGAEGNVLYNYPELAQKAAEERIKEAPNTNAKIISADGLCAYNLGRVTPRSMELSRYIKEKLHEVLR